jgi:hypothetical protein
MTYRLTEMSTDRASRAYNAHVTCDYLVITDGWEHWLLSAIIWVNKWLSVRLKISLDQQLNQLITNWEMLDATSLSSKTGWETMSKASLKSVKKHPTGLSVSSMPVTLSKRFTRDANWSLMTLFGIACRKEKLPHKQLLRNSWQKCCDWDRSKITIEQRVSWL